MKRNHRSAFSLVEVMIVVMILGILLTIAVPNFIRARQQGRVQTVVGNLKQLESAKEQWALDQGKGTADVPAAADLVPGYIKAWPKGPVGNGADYVPNDLASRPTFKGVPVDDFQDPATRDAAIAACGL
ncbi:MAG TPA: prepilin-type cleavage/methylation domain-containing protein [Nitrospira sp.]|nr:prepilin-type cleavage/methylation domain-containing protein [Nitrospira sp.]